MMREQFCHKSVKRTPWISEFIKAVDTSSAKLKEYYFKTGGPAETQYALAALLDPSQKLSIFAAPEWGRPWSRKYAKEFVGHWSANYQKLAVTKDNQPQSSTAPQFLNSIFQHHRQSIGPSRVSTVAMNEAEQYLQAPLIGEDSETPVWQLWKRIEPSYPSLTTIA
jgi:hypothetical protein